MDTLLKIAIAAVIAAILALLLKKDVPETALLLVLAAAAIMMGCILSTMSAVRGFLDTLSELSGLSSAVIAPLIKTLAIAIVCKLAGDVCRDASQSALASTVELAGAVTAVYLAIPLIRTALDMVLAFI